MSRVAPKPPSCARCDDSGMVLLDRVAEGGGRTSDAYRCECPTGAGLSKLFRLAPPAERPALSLWRSRKDIDG